MSDPLDPYHPPTALRPALLLGSMHAVVDGSCAALVAHLGLLPTISPETLWLMYFVYNLLAFGIQFVLGVGADRRGLYRQLAVGGLVAVLAGVALGTLPSATWAAIVVAGLGNAAFHVGAGAIILQRSPDRAAATGVLVAPGALGLAVGQWAATGAAWPPISVGLLMLSVVVAWWLGLGGASQIPLRPAATPTRGPILGLALAALMLSVAIRSAAGFAVAKAHSEVPAVLWGLTLAAVAGKALGGFLADWLGWIRTSVITTLVAASLLGLANANSAAIVVGTIFLQVTMSVTLLAIYRAFPEEPGLAFGLPTLALLVGALPSLVFSNAWITPPLTLLVALLASALCLAIGLPPIVGIRNREAAQPPSPAAIPGQRPSVSRPVGGKSEMRNPKSETNSKPKGPKLSPP